MNVDTLSRMRRKADFYAQAPAWVHQIWPTFDSFNWFIKTRAKVLSSVGAIRKLGRDWFVDEQLFAQEVAVAFGLDNSSNSTDTKDKCGYEL